MYSPDAESRDADVTARVDRVLLDLRALGAEIANLDFGYPVEEATFESGAAPSRIESVAAVVGEPLPVDYRYFLSQCAGFTGMDFHNGYAVHTPEEVVRLFREAGAPRQVLTDRGAVPVLPVASDGGGNVFLLKLRMPHVVLRWDHEIGETGAALPPGHPGFREVADGFVVLLERIRADWSHFLGPDPEAWTYIT